MTLKEYLLNNGSPTADIDDDCFIQQTFTKTEPIIKINEYFELI